jgi:hypothetical protein
MGNGSRRRRGVGAGLLAVAAAPVAYLAALNGFANFVLPGLLSRSPDRLVVGWDRVWMWLPGRVASMDGLEVRGAGPRGTWTLHADHARGTVDVLALLGRSLDLRDVAADGVTFALVPTPGPPPRGAPWPLRVEGRASGRRIELDGAAFTGAVDAGGVLTLADALSTDVTAEVRDGALELGGETVATAIHGPVAVRVTDWPRGERLGRSGWERVDGRARLGADIEGLSFLAPYLERAPWLSLVGTGTLSTELVVEDGVLGPGSVVDAETRDLSVRFLSYDVRGDGVVHAEVTETLGMPVSLLDVSFGAFTIGEPEQAPLVEGAGFTITGSSPDVSLASPFSTVELRLDLPPSRIPDLRSLNPFLPTDVGVALTGGRGAVEGSLAVGTRDGVATGRAVFTGDDVTARIDALDLVFDLELVAPLREARLSEHLYDFSGTRLALRDLGIAEPEGARGPRWSRERTWWSEIEVPAGRALVGRAEYLRADVSLAAADASAFVRVVSQRKDLPGWLQKALALPDVRGAGHLVLGLGAIDLEPMTLTAGRHFEVGLRWHRRPGGNDGAMFAAWRDLSVGFGFTGADRALVPFGARDWFAGSPAAPAVASAPIEEERRPVIRWRRKDPPAQTEP